MLYLVALLIPPLALLLCGKPIQAILSAVLWVIAWITSVIFGAGFIMWVILAIWSIMVVKDRNTKKLIEEARRDD